MAARLSTTRYMPPLGNHTPSASSVYCSKEYVAGASYGLSPRYMFWKERRLSDAGRGSSGHVVIVFEQCLGPEEDQEDVLGAQVLRQVVEVAADEVPEGDVIMPLALGEKAEQAVEAAAASTVRPTIRSRLQER